MEIAWFDIVGSVGVATILATYVLLQTNRLSSDGLLYSILNGGGAALIAFSLLFKFNLAAFIVEAAWVVISIYGILRYYMRRKQ